MYRMKAIARFQHRPFITLMRTTASALISTSATIATTSSTGMIVRLLELMSVIFNLSKPPRSLQLTVFFKLLIDDCDEDRKETPRLIRSEDVDGANAQIG